MPHYQNNNGLRDTIMANPTLLPSNLEKPRRRLLRQYRRLGSYQKLADARGVNIRYVYEFLVHNTIPANRQIQVALGLYIHRSVTINQLLQLPIRDQPTEILRLAFENRVEVKS
jgi:hypothetical protein